MVLHGLPCFNTYCAFACHPQAKSARSTPERGQTFVGKLRAQVQSLERVLEKFIASFSTSSRVRVYTEAF